MLFLAQHLDFKRDTKMTDLLPVFFEQIIKDPGSLITWNRPVYWADSRCRRIPPDPRNVCKADNIGWYLHHGQ